MNMEAKDEIRAILLQLGWNMWSDVPVRNWGKLAEMGRLGDVCAADHLRTDWNVWRKVTDCAAACGYNMILLDLGEACVYPSHPELAVRGSLEPDRMRKELDRLRKLGLEPIPKLNFSTAHDTWLKDCHRAVSTPEYYRTCADVIRDVCEIFGKPRFFHLGYDEETASAQSQYGFSVVRQGDLWWHDFLFLSGTVEKCGMRPWIWSDYMWHHLKDFLAKMPRSVLQSNWYYGKDFAVGAPPPKGLDIGRVDCYLELDRAGFDQVPCSSACDNDVSFGRTVEFCRKRISSDRLKGFLMAPWTFICPAYEKKTMEACELGRTEWRTRG